MGLLSGCAAYGLPFKGEDSKVSEMPEECKGSTDFASVLVRLLDSGEENLAVSPLSAYIALAMTAEGASGDTLTQFEHTLGASVDDISKAVNTIGNHLMELKGSTKIALAQSVWTDEDIEFSESYIKDIGNKYTADLFSGKLSSDAIREAINRWASDKTNGLIENFLGENLPEETVMALMNSLYFKGTWQKEFDSETWKDDFTNYDGTTGKAEYMYSSSNYSYIDSDNAVGVVVPYDDGKTEFIALMPKETATLPSAMACKLGTQGIAELADNAKSVKVNLTLPAFTTESSSSMKDALVMMGLSDAFNAQLADFSQMGEGNFVVSNVMQKVRITVDTKGTEAAAVTMVGVDTTAMPVDEPVVLNFNRPFFYVIMDKETAMPLFMGTYNYAK